MRISRKITLLLAATALSLFGAAPNRLTKSLSGSRTRSIPGTVHRQAKPQFARGPLGPTQEIHDITLVFKPSDAQQQDLDQLLADQQKPASPQFHKWLTPEVFADRFGLNPADQARITQWLTDHGLTVDTTARSRNWVRFSGTTDRVSSALRTTFQRFNVAGEDHFANVSEPELPEELAAITAGFVGLDDFIARPRAKGARPLPEPAFTSGTNHYLAPQDFSTIYNLTPLAAAGYDGAGQSIVIVGQSNILLSDIRAFRTRFGLPANDPVFLPYSTTEPGFTGSQFEGNLDVEWAGALAPRATIYYIYGTNAFTATIAAINANQSPVISISYGLCELDVSLNAYRVALQQGNAQGITILASSGDSGAGGCEVQGVSPYASNGRYTDFPAVAPEVTAVGGTQFNEGTGNYWAPGNTAQGGSALSYIPEKAWNESDQSGLLATGGGASVFIPKPAWQTGPGVPADKARDVPDMSFSAAIHDGYLVTYLGGLYIVGGTSASSPSFAGLLALLNQYQVRRGFQKTPGLGNINPQLYRMAVTTPNAFHDIVEGDNIVPCLQGTQDCLTGSFGYKAGPGYDLATGLGTLDANNFVTQYNQSGSPVNVSLVIAPNPVTLNDTVAFFATLTPSGTTVPAGTIQFSNGAITLATTPLTAGPNGSYSAIAVVPASLVGFGTYTITASYSGDNVYSGAGATGRLRITAPAAPLSAVTLAAPVSVFALPQEPNGLTWPVTVQLTERNNIPAIITGYSIDGVPQKLSDLFPVPTIPAGRSVTSRIILRGQPTPVDRTIVFTGTDATGTIWTRQVTVTLLPQPVYTGATISAIPLVMQRNPAAPANCQWSQRITIDNTFGVRQYILQLFQGNRNISTSIPTMFGTTRLEAWSSASGTMCWSDITAPDTTTLTFVLSEDNGSTFQQDLFVAFNGPAITPGTLSAAPAAVTINAHTVGPIPPVANFTLNLADKSQQWTASIFPANRTTSWLKLSQMSGTGPATLNFQANGAGFAPGAYNATVVFQSPSAVPQYVAVPVMFVNGATPGTAITGAGNAFSYLPNAAPGMVLAVYGAGLSSAAQSATKQPLPYSLGGTSVTINGIPAPLYYVSPNQVNVQVPYWLGSGPAVVGVNNNGAIAGYQFQITPTAPGILTDGSGKLLPTAKAAQGAAAALYITGDGEVSPTLDSGYAPATGTALGSLPRPVQPISVTVGGQQALISFYGITPGVVGMTQVNYLVPAGVAPGPQPVVVTVGGVASQTATLEVTAAIK